MAAIKTRTPTTRTTTLPPSPLPTTTTTTTTLAAVTTAENAVQKYDNFLDDPFNMAMYVVLPAMVFVYGGCCVIYCMAKLHRFCRRRARRRAKQQKRLLHKDSEDSDDDPPITARSCRGGGAKSLLSVVDVGDPIIEPFKPVKPFKPAVPFKPAPPVKPAPPAVPVKPVPPAVPVKPVPPAETFSSVRSVRPAVYPKPAPMPLPPRGRQVGVGGSYRAEGSSSSSSSSSTVMSARGVQPGYVKNQDLQQHMQHLDDQLKAAFHMISEEPKAIRSRPDLCASNNENKRSITRRSGKSWIQFYVSDQ